MTLGIWARVGASRAKGTERWMTEARVISARVMRSVTRNVRVERCFSTVRRPRS